ncbi:YheC/YheD family protein [Paenibacillus sambharensis]|uniref:YheC/YheD family protein n=1 Tax=Paenibacillus sambharensis TaxID=1803190 RepID=A0A2W1L4G5_9BACL|nr:YheC/YheD family protein [Paenibacillus sambharensis]PZD94256.1 YheC/YheD family protein [Paenibacillus sambharensis]
MQKSKLAVQIVSSGIIPDDTLMLGEAYVKHWKIPQGQPVWLKFGSYRQHVKIISVQRYDGLRISHSLARRMGLARNLTLRMQYRPSMQTLSLGPLIGVMVSRDYPQTPDRPFGAITQFCKELVDACETQGAHVYFFTPSHINSSSSLEAWVYGHGWRRMKVPVADVLNNRLTTRKLENKSSVQHFWREVKSRYGTQVFNEKFLDKSEVFDALKHDSSLHRYLPESHLLRNFTILKAMCSRYSSVFLKPVRGSLGKGIIKVTKASSSGYNALHATVGGTRKQHYTSLLKLFASISGKMKTVKYQIQQGLQLIDIQKRPVDFRALVQKNATGKWAVTSIVARVAGGQHFVSNLARGGSLSTVKEAIAKSNVASSAKKDASSRLNRAALDIAVGVDQHIPAHFGELGIDLAMDVNGRVWLLEVNSKPSKNDNTPLTDKGIRPSVRIMLQYARHLAGF